MKNILKNLVPYWKTVILIVAFLMVQAYCDLALPQYTSKIIDTGIQNQGIEHILPEKITPKEYQEAELFMEKEEKQLWEDSYRKEGKVYRRRAAEEEELEALDHSLLTPIAMTHQLGHMSEGDFRKMMQSTLEKNQTAGVPVPDLEKLSLKEIGSLLHMDIDTVEMKDEKGKLSVYVDMRPVIREMTERGVMDESMIDDARRKMEDTLETMGDSTVKSMGTAYAAFCSREAGVDMEQVQMAYLRNSGFSMLLVALLMLAASVLVSFLAAKVGAGVGRDLRAKVFEKVIGFSSGEMDTFSTSSLITRNTNDIQQIQMVTAVMLRMVLYAPIIGIGGIYRVAKTGAHMGWIVGLALLLIMGFVLLLLSLSMPKFKQMQTIVDSLNRVSREILTGLSVIRAFGREKTEEERFDRVNNKLKKTQLFTNRVMTFMMPGLLLIMNCLVILITWVSAHRIDAGTLQVGVMTAFITYSMLIVMAFLMITAMSVMLPRAGVAADRIEEVLTTEQSVRDAEDAEELRDCRGRIEFEEVSFRYPGAKEDVLHKISFTAEPGKVTAIIGSTGAGKSTMLNLIPRFYDVTAGRITIDGRDIRSLSLKSLRRAIGLVPQKGILFSGTIASNLGFGAEEAEEEDIERAAEIAQATEFIEEKEEGFNSPIAQGGSNVSGGQKQRLAIGRALAKHPKILLFDDSFSALDMKTDAKLRRELRDRVSGVTEIIIAQRVSTILHADQILVLDDGEIVGAGTHRELMASCEVYQQIAKSQLSESELEAQEVNGNGAE